MFDLLAALKGVKGREGAWTARCPAHDDQANSLSIGTGDDARWLIKCHSGCPTRAVVDALGITLADLMPERAAHPKRHVATYPYHAPDGTLAYEVLRYDPKDFRQRRPDGAGGWIWNLKDVPRYLYRLPALMDAETLFITEGEKDADRLGALGLNATTKAGGATDWREEFCDQLVAARVRRVWMIPDNDPPGSAYADRVVATCRKAGLVAHRLDLPGLPPKGDVSDWLDTHTVSDLLALTLAASRPSAPVPEAPPELEAVTAGLTETSHAQRFAVAYGDELRFDHKRGIWLVYEGGRWRPDPTGHVRRCAIAFVRSRQRAALDDEGDDKKRALSFLLAAEKKKGIDNLVTAAQSMLPLADAGITWDVDPWLLGTPDGIVDLRTGQSRAGDPSDRVTFSTAVSFDAEAQCPDWDAFLGSIFEDDPKLIGFVQRFVGYSLTGITTEQVLVLCYGRGANGKSTLLNTLRKVLGDYSHNLPFSSLELRAAGGIPNDMAALAGRRFVVASETTEGSRLNEGRIKALTGGDPISARFMHGEFFTFEPQGKFWLSVNHKPEISDDTVSLWRRIRLVPFLKTFTGSACDPNLPARLAAEAPGILAWAVRGCLAWQAEGLDAPASVHAATAEYQAESDVLAEFIDATFDVDFDSEVKASVLQELYVKWADRERIGRRDRLTAKKLAAKFADRFPKRHTREGWFYEGLKVVTDKLW